MVHDKCWGALGLFDEDPQKDDRACPSGWWARTSYLNFKSYDWNSTFVEKTKTFSITCLDIEDKCLRGLCECDKAVALELGRQSREKGCRYQNPGCDKSKPIP